MTSLYLSSTLSPAQNLGLVAQGQIMTKDYADIHEEFMRQEFPATISTLVISTVALGIISVVITVLVHRKTGIVLACLCVVPMIGLFYTWQRETGFRSRLESVSHQMQMIFSEMTIYLDGERNFKEEALIQHFNELRIATSQIITQRLQELTKEFDQGKWTFSKPEDIQRYKNHEKIVSCARLILNIKKPPVFPSDIGDKLHASCLAYLYGARSQLHSKTSYLSIYHDGSGWKVRR